MKLSDWFRRGVKGIQRSSQKRLFRHVYACTPIKGYNCCLLNCISFIKILFTWGPEENKICLLSYLSIDQERTAIVDVLCSFYVYLRLMSIN
jgi:hypothetical protein